MASPSRLPAALQRPEPIPLDQRICWSYTELSLATGLSEPTLRGLVRQGLPHCKVGDRVLFLPAAVLEFFEQRLIRLNVADAPPVVADDAAESSPHRPH